MELTVSHWSYLVVVLLVILGMVLRCGVIPALGQMGAIWSGGGTLIPWGVLDISGVTGVSPEELTRRNFLPVMAGLLAATVLAIFLM